MAYATARPNLPSSVKTFAENVLVQQLLEHTLTLAPAESCTCGLTAAQLAPAPAVSAVLLERRKGLASAVQPGTRQVAALQPHHKA